MVAALSFSSLTFCYCYWAAGGFVFRVASAGNENSIQLEREIHLALSYTQMPLHRMYFARVLYELAADAVEGTRRLSRVKCIQQWHGHKRCIYSRDSKTIALIKLFANGETFPSILIYLSADLREKKNAWHSESDFFFLVSFLFAAATPAMVIIRCDEQIFEWFYMELHFI